MKSLFKTMFVFAFAVVSGCAPKLYVNVLKPAGVNFGPAKKLSVVESQGRRSARETVIQELVNQARSASYFTVSDRSEEGITVKVAGRNVEVSGGKGPPQSPDEIGLRIDVQEWSANKDTQTQRDAKGNITRTYSVYAGKVVLGVTAFAANGKTFIAEKEYKGQFNSENSEDDAINGAARQAVAMLLGDVTPSYVRQAVQLDDEDQSQKPIIEMARNGDLARATQEERAVVEKNGTSPSALYNLGVMLDAQGLYKEALEFYDRAIKLKSVDLYIDAKAECARRLADAEAMNNM
jgi:tetratricopeptide (TPR) repeat protein